MNPTRQQPVSTFPRRCALLMVCALAPTIACAQEQPSQRADDMVAWAPNWKVGDWWLVKVYQPYVDVHSADESPARTRPGIPAGYEPANRILYTVKRRALVTYANDPKDTPPEAFLVVEARSLDGLRERVAELWYTEEDLSLAKVVFNGKKCAGMLSGTAQLDVQASGALGVPLEWPDFRAAKEPEAKLFGHCGARLEQETAEDGVRIRVRLSAAAPKKQQRKLQAPPGARVQKKPAVEFEWREGLPCWTRVRTRSRYAELVRHGSADDLPRRLRGKR